MANARQICIRRYKVVLPIDCFKIVKFSLVTDSTYNLEDIWYEIIFDELFVYIKYDMNKVLDSDIFKNDRINMPFRIIFEPNKQADETIQYNDGILKRYNDGTYVYKGTKLPVKLNQHKEEESDV